MDDQDALNDVVERPGSPCQVWYIPSRFMVFAADYGALLTRPRTMFVHVTHTARQRLTGRLAWWHRTLARMLWGYTNDLMSSEE